MLKTPIYKIIPFIIIFFFYNSISHGQMPDWTLVIDKDENRYYIDKNGKIWTSGEPEFDYKPVSMEGLDYYINQGIELIRSHNKIEGLILLKSVMALPVKNEIVYKAQIKASKEINNLIKNEGTRFKKLNENASPLLIKENNSVTLINDGMFYSLKCPPSFKIISKRVREKINYYYFGLLMGFRFNKEVPKDKIGYSGYDLLIAIDSERFPYIIKNAKSVEEHWRNRLGYDTLERITIISNNNQILKSYKDIYPPNYSGFEGFYSKSKYGYYLKAITSKELFQRYKTEIMEIINNFKI